LLPKLPNKASTNLGAIQGHYLENEAAVENYVIHMRKDAGLLKELVHDKITFAPLDIKGLAQRAAEILEGGEWKAWARRRTKTKSAAAPKAAER
jgi:hypothetical protein